MELFYNIKIIRKLKKLNQVQFAELLGVNNTVLSNWEREIATPNIEMIQKIANLGGITIDSLLNTKLIELNTNKSNNNRVSYKNEIPATVIEENDSPYKIPVIPVDAMAGFANGDTQVMQHEIIENYVIPEFTHKGVKYLIRVGGSSMYPKYSNGDLLACRPIKDQSFFQWGKVYVLDTDQGPLVKRLFPYDINPELIECRSDNFENYPPFQISKQSIRKISIVVGVIRLE